MARCCRSTRYTKSPAFEPAAPRSLWAAAAAHRRSSTRCRPPARNYRSQEQQHDAAVSYREAPRFFPSPRSPKLKLTINAGSVTIAAAERLDPEDRFNSTCGGRGRPPPPTSFGRRIASRPQAARGAPSRLESSRSASTAAFAAPSTPATPRAPWPSRRRTAREHAADSASDRDGGGDIGLIAGKPGRGHYRNAVAERARCGRWPPTTELRAPQDHARHSRRPKINIAVSTSSYTGLIRVSRADVRG